MHEEHIGDWPERIKQRYENYLRTSFFFKDPTLRLSFKEALQREGALLSGPFPEPARQFQSANDARTLAGECFPSKSSELYPALLPHPLYSHQERAIRATHIEGQNVVVATGTASGKTESFLYPILFELYRQHLAGELSDPGVRALILYPMNALANDQRERLGTICEALRHAGSGFAPTFGQYIGQTPENDRDTYRNAKVRIEERIGPSELVLREEMRATPPHILLTNYSMLEYLLIRPDDSPLFDDGRGARWQFIVLDEAHQYRGAKGMEMGMLIRRLKERLRKGGRRSGFRCIATSATISTGTGPRERQAVAEFAEQLFGEGFSPDGVIFSAFNPSPQRGPRRYHAFLRALEGAFLVNQGGKDEVVLNRKSVDETAEPLEIALCRECGQHYYVGREQGGRLAEAIRDPSHYAFGVDYYLPTDDGDRWLCRTCALLSGSVPTCDCGTAIKVKRCEPHKQLADQLARCESCEYQRGGIGDPVQEIVHGSDGPNAVVVTALHELLPAERRKILAFADSRQEAAFFAWYAEDSYRKLRDRNLILRAINGEAIGPEGLSIDDLQSRLLSHWTDECLFRPADTAEYQRRRVLTSILREVLTDERRLSLVGVGAARSFVGLPGHYRPPEMIFKPPWNFTEEEAKSFVSFTLDEMRRRRAVNLPTVSAPAWTDVSDWPQTAYRLGAPKGLRNVFEWGSAQSAMVAHFLRRALDETRLPDHERRTASARLMKAVWHGLREVSEDPVLAPAKDAGTFRLNPRWLRFSRADATTIWECDTCATVSVYNIRGICPRNRCPGGLVVVNRDRLAENHYRILYESEDLPPALTAEEHTAQVDSREALLRQDSFKEGRLHLLSSSTTFEVGVDLGDLDVVFLRNVPPEPFNYAQRVGRAGRREGRPGLAITYCRRNPHDLYHYEDPEERILRGVVRPPRLMMTNEKIILRHMVATAMSWFFRDNRGRFRRVEDFVGNWEHPTAASDLRTFCATKEGLTNSLRRIVPTEMHGVLGLSGDHWIDRVAGSDGRLAYAEKEACADYRNMTELRDRYFDDHRDGLVARIGRRMKTIAQERTLNFLSRKAVIPKYGFPVDVVELEARTSDGNATGVSLQRNLSQAIAEYAPGGKVVANKKEWESCGIKAVPGKAWPVRHYHYDDQHHFQQWNEGDPSVSDAATRKYLIPEFGFVTPLQKNPKEPHGRTRRMYTTRPFFCGFGVEDDPVVTNVRGVLLTKAVPGKLVVLCEGKERAQFQICRRCGAHMSASKAIHRSPNGLECEGMLERFALGHELVTDVMRIQFQGVGQAWDAYSVGYALLLGAAEVLNVPDTDLSVTITAGPTQGTIAVVLYDNVPGGAGLVVQLEQEETFSATLDSSLSRVQGGCGCDSSCYGCLRSYRNQFAHPHLNRIRAQGLLDAT